MEHYDTLIHSHRIVAVLTRIIYNLERHHLDLWLNDNGWGTRVWHDCDPIDANYWTKQFSPLMARGYTHEWVYDSTSKRLLNDPTDSHKEHRIS